MHGEGEWFRDPCPLVALAGDRAVGCEVGTMCTRPIRWDDIAAGEVDREFMRLAPPCLHSRVQTWTGWRYRPFQFQGNRSHTQTHTRLLQLQRPSRTHHTHAWGKGTSKPNQRHRYEVQSVEKVQEPCQKKKSKFRGTSSNWPTADQGISSCCSAVAPGPA